MRASAPIFFVLCLVACGQTNDDGGSVAMRENSDGALQAAIDNYVDARFLSCSDGLHYSPFGDGVRERTAQRLTTSISDAPLTEADRLNGVERRVMVEMRETAHRERHKGQDLGWTEWSEWQEADGGCRVMLDSANGTSSQSGSGYFMGCFARNTGDLSFHPKPSACE